MVSGGTCSMANSLSPSTHAPNETHLIARTVDAVWRFFTSVKVALWLIGATIGWVLIATLAQSYFPGWIAEQVPALKGLMVAWNNWEVWLSPPFLITLGVLSISIVLGGMVNRWSGIAQRVWHPNIRTSPGFFKVVGNHDEIVTTSMIAGVTAFATVAKKRRYCVLSHTDAKTGAVHLYADKNRYSPLATFPFHTGLVLIMLGAVWIASAGWREIGFLVPDGSSRPVGHYTGLVVTSKGFVDEYYNNASPRDYYSDLEISNEQGRLVMAKRLRVNDPINIGAISFHQATFGNAAKFIVRDSQAHTVFEDGIPLLQPTRSAQAVGVGADAAGEVRSIGVLQLDDLGIILRLVSSGGPLDETISAGQIALAVFDNRAIRGAAGPLGTATLDPGASTTISGLTFTFQREVRFTGLQITYAPGLPLIYIASAMIFLSVIVTFYLPQRRLRALLTTMADGQVRMQLGLQAKLDPGGAREFTEMTRSIRQACLQSLPIGKRGSFPTEAS